MSSLENYEVIRQQNAIAVFAEKYVLGTILLSHGISLDGLKLESSMFFDRDLGRSFDVLRYMREANNPIDGSTFVSAAKSSKSSNGTLFSDVGGSAGIAAWSEFASVAQAEYYAEQVEKWWRVRHMRSKLQSSLAAIDSVNANPSEIANRLDAMLQTQIQAETNNYHTVGSAAADALEESLLEINHTLVVPFGYKDWDARLGGLYKRELTVIGARPSVGKTAMALGIAMNAAIAGKQVMYVACEMSHKAFGHRLLSRETGIPVCRIRNGYLTESEKEQLHKAVEVIRPLTARVWCKAGPTVQAIRARARMDLVGPGLDLVVIDYLSKLRATSKGSEYERITELVGDIAEMASDLDIPVLLMSQLNREAGKTSEPPRLEHLRSSGAIEQDADNVVFIHRQRGESETMIVIAKQRQGQVQSFDMRFDGDRCRFEDIDSVPPEGWEDANGEDSRVTDFAPR